MEQETGSDFEADSSENTEVEAHIRSLTKAILSANRLIGHPEIPRPTAHVIHDEHMDKMQKLQELAEAHPGLARRIADEEQAKLRAAPEEEPKEE